MSFLSGSIKEQWKYIFKIFPIIDIAFGTLAVLLSSNWIITLSALFTIPSIAGLILYVAEKKNFQPGYLLFFINGAVFMIAAYYSGPQSPTWLWMINMTVGASFLFKNPRIGQILIGLFAVFLGLFYYWMGASVVVSTTISLILLAFIVLFSHAYYYLQFQQSKIESKSKELEAKNKDITDSINYAQKIQHAVLPNEENIYRNIPLSFILFKPRDIVSGDFFWFHELDRDNYIIVCADCTGHGVPGAMMTVVGSSLLNQIIIENKISSPSAILSELDKKINETLKQEKTRAQSVQDGMDLSLIKVDKARKQFIFTSAKRPALFIRNKQMQEIKGSKSSLGGMRMGEKIFDEIKMDFKEDDMIYFYTDGITDQFGGEKGKKYSSKRLRETLLAIHELSMSEQKLRLESTIDKWKRDTEQIDDILIMGIRF